MSGATTKAPAWLQDVGSFIRVGGQAYSAFSEVLALDAESRARVRAAEDALRIGKERAAIVTKQGRAVLGGAIADYAASGVRVDAGGSVAEAEGEIREAVERDVLNILFESQRQALELRLEAKQLRRGARLRLATGALQVAGTALGG